MGRANGDDEHHRLPLGALRRFHNGMEKEPKLLRPRDAALGPLRRFLSPLHYESEQARARNNVEKKGAGVWREYLNGKVVNEYSGDTVPGTQEFDSSTIWEKQTHNINWKK